ncbi:MAG: hypothetical protein KDB08_02035 [Microthrixaceae bacterium]|nr:hypothetical protein [Microthrixaceae bacterium]
MNSTVRGASFAERPLGPVAQHQWQKSVTGGIRLAIRDILDAVGRRWYVLVVGLLVTAGAGWFVVDSNPPEYTARGLVLLLPSVGVESSDGANPLLELGGLELTARVLVATYSSTSFEQELAELSPDATAVVSIDESTRGPVIVVEVTDVGQQRALDTLGYVLGTVSTRLLGLQNEVGVAENAMVRSMVLAMDTEAEPDLQSLIRVLVLVLGGGIAVTVALTLVIDVLAGRRKQGRGGRKHSKIALQMGPGSNGLPEIDGVEPRDLPDSTGVPRSTVRLSSREQASLTVTSRRATPRPRPAARGESLQ